MSGITAAVPNGTASREMRCFVAQGTLADQQEKPRTAADKQPIFREPN